jgi:hypothetical protein
LAAKKQRKLTSTPRANGLLYNDLPSIERFLLLSDEQKAEAEKHARETDGVTSVKNELVVKPK